MGISKYNSEGYPDPTAYAAVRNAEKGQTGICGEAQEGGGYAASGMDAEEDGMAACHSAGDCRAATEG